MKTLGILKVFLGLKGKELWASGKTAKVIGIVGIWYCSGVWLFGGYILRPFKNTAFPTIEYGVGDKYICAPFIFAIIIGICIVTGFASKEIIKWIKLNWMQARNIYLGREYEIKKKLKDRMDKLKKEK